jgi:hypothetical protein
MEDLKRSYTDIRNVTHRVEHQVVPAADAEDREQLLAALVDALTNQARSASD